MDGQTRLPNPIKWIMCTHSKCMRDTHLHTQTYRYCTLKTHLRQWWPLEKTYMCFSDPPTLRTVEHNNRSLKHKTSSFLYRTSRDGEYFILLTPDFRTLLNTKCILIMTQMSRCGKPSSNPRRVGCRNPKSSKHRHLWNNTHSEWIILIAWNDSRNFIMMQPWRLYENITEQVAASVLEIGRHKVSTTKYLCLEFFWCSQATIQTLLCQESSSHCVSQRARLDYHVILASAPKTTYMFCHCSSLNHVPSTWNSPSNNIRSFLHKPSLNNPEALHH